MSYVILPLLLICHKPRHAMCLYFVVWRWNHIEYPYDKNCNLPITLNAFYSANGYNILDMQAPRVLIPFILTTRYGFTLMATSTFKIIIFGVQKTPMNLREMVYILKNRDLIRNFKKKKLLDLSFFKQLTLLAIKKLFKILSWIWRRKTNSISFKRIVQLSIPPTTDFLSEFFDTQIILKNPWPPCSSDLSYMISSPEVMRNKVVTHDLTSIEGLKVKITEIIHSIDVQMQRKVFWNLLKGGGMVRSKVERRHYKHIL